MSVLLYTFCRSLDCPFGVKGPTLVLPLLQLPFLKSMAFRRMPVETRLLFVSFSLFNLKRVGLSVAPEGAGSCVFPSVSMDLRLVSIVSLDLRLVSIVSLDLRRRR